MFVYLLFILAAIDLFLKLKLTVKPEMVILDTRYLNSNIFFADNNLLIVPPYLTEPDGILYGYEYHVINSVCRGHLY